MNIFISFHIVNQNHTKSVVFFSTNQHNYTGASLDTFYWGTCLSINLKFKLTIYFICQCIHIDNRVKKLVYMQFSNLIHVRGGNTSIAI